MEELQLQTSSEKREEARCTNVDNCANKIIALAVITIQIAAYAFMTLFLIDTTETQIETRGESCYGPNCGLKAIQCLDLTTGGLISILLIGFLWADVVNTISLFWNSCCCKFCCCVDDNKDEWGRTKYCCNRGDTAFMSCIILAELS